MDLVNSHVTRLNRYLPFSPAHDQIYEEYQKSTDSLNLETKALLYLSSAITRNARVLILTGDAGHGKTHLCRRLLEVYLDYDEDAARRLINTVCDGTSLIGHASNEDVVNLRIYKDFSELTIDNASRSLEDALSSNKEITIICANEGRLRAVLESGNSGGNCKVIKKKFINSFDSGLASRDGKIHIVNLNYQSISSIESKSLISRALNDWLDDGRRWTQCNNCSSKDKCPIYHNRNMLSQQVSSNGIIRQEKLESVFAAVERLRNVITIRDMLMSIAYLLTGGLDCTSVHSRIRAKKIGWQYQFAYYNLLFNRPENLSEDQLSRIPVLGKIALLDPGLRAFRDVDERLINSQDVFEKGQIDLIFEYRRGKKAEWQYVDASSGIDEVIGNPRNKSERTREAEFIKLIVRALRRRAFFDESSEFGTVMKRLGFEFGDTFLSVINREARGKDLTRLKGRLISGLHTIQGLQLAGNQTNFYIVDPAFGSATSHAAIMAGKVVNSKIKLLPMSDAWDVDEDRKDWAITQSVDWIDRHVVLRIASSSERGFEDIPLDLMLFDCITRAAFGYVAEEFYSHDLRKIIRFLGILAERFSDDESDLQIFLHGEMHSVSIDDDVIQVA